MFSFKMESTGSANRTKVDFPVDYEPTTQTTTTESYFLFFMMF